MTLNTQNLSQTALLLFELKKHFHSQGENPDFTFRASTCELEFCDYINKIAAAVETGHVHSGPDLIPKPFATADVFEKFLGEVNAHYKHSVDRWAHSFRSVVDTANEIRRTNAFAS